MPHSITKISGLGTIEGGFFVASSRISIKILLRRTLRFQQKNQQVHLIWFQKLF